MYFLAYRGKSNKDNEHVVGTSYISKRLILYSYWSLQPVASVTIRVTGVVSVESFIVSQIAVH